MSTSKGHAKTWTQVTPSNKYYLHKICKGDKGKV